MQSLKGVYAFGLCIALMGAMPASGAYLGDTVIYSATAVASDSSRPNVLFIIDNSRATLNTARGQSYRAADGSLVEYEGNYSKWTVYEVDNQGDFSKTAVTNTTMALENMTCSANNNIIETTLLQWGTYAGAGTSTYPNLKFGACDTAPKGAVYALGNYLNYLESTSGSDSGGSGEPGDQTCQDPPRVRACKSNKPNQCGNFILRESHTSVVSPADDDSSDAPYWISASPGNSGFPAWMPNYQYTMPSCGDEGAGESTVTEEGGKTQRQIIYDALNTVVGGTRSYVNFGAMTYGGNNSGGKLVYGMADLSADSDFNAFRTAIPGPGATDGEWVLDSNTGRPQAEALFDAGYYFDALGSGCSSVTNTTQIGSAGSVCGFNHIILITNGLTNGDDSPNLDAVGDADGDNYPDEDVYGLGSHWLDDVAKYLKENSGVTTHTVLAFQNYDSLVHNAAVDGGGSFYNVFNEEELAEALTKLLANIVKETDTAFVAPVVPTNPENRTFSGHRVYLGFFYPKSNQAWYGNLKKFGINAQNQIVDSSNPPKVAVCPDATDTHCAANDINDGNFRLDAKSYWSSSADGGIVEAGGIGAKLLARNLDPAGGGSVSSPRKIFSYDASALTNVLTDSAHAFTTANTAFTAALLGVADDTEKNKLIAFIHGMEAYAPANDLDGNGLNENAEKREWLMGDILHSKPLVVNYNNFSYSNESACTGTDANRSIVFVGANDGMLHAFRDCSGDEAWAFIPPDLLPDLKNLPGDEHHIYVDSSPVAYKYDKDGDGEIESGDGEWVMLIFGLRRGGSAYYALDVTDPENPKYLWKITPSTSGFEELGQSWSEPQFGLVKDGAAKKVVGFIGAGYDNLNEDQRFGNTQNFTGSAADPANSVGAVTSAGSTTDLGNTGGSGRGVYAFLIATFDNSGALQMATSPTLVWKFTRRGSTATHGDLSYNQQKLVYSFPSDVSPIDTDFDGFIDRLYVGDTGGRMWRISDHYTSGAGTSAYHPKPNPNISTWFGKIIFNANAGADGSNGRKIFYRPSVVHDNGYIGVYFGTGDRAHPLNTAVVDRLYAVFDKKQRTNQDIGEADMEDVAADYLQAAAGTTSETCTANSTALNCILERLGSSSNYGWYIRMDTNYGANTGEKILAPALVFNKVAYYTTYTPNPSPNVVESAEDCAGNLGTSRMWAVDYHTGEAVFNFNKYNDDTSDVTNQRAMNKAGDVVMNYQDRFKDLGVGIPSGLVMVINAEGDAQVLIGCGGGVCPGDSLPGGTVFPVYWMPW